MRPRTKRLIASVRTNTPIEKADANARAVFGDHISIYDILRAVEDKATVPIYCEGRLAKLALKEIEKCLRGRFEGSV